MRNQTKKVLLQTILTISLIAFGFAISPIIELASNLDMPFVNITYSEFNYFGYEVPEKEQLRMIAFFGMFSIATFWIASSCINELKYLKNEDIYLQILEEEQYDDEITKNLEKELDVEKITKNGLSSIYVHEYSTHRSRL